MKVSYKQSFKISSYDLTPRGDARLTSLVNFFQEIAYQQAEKLGFGYHEMYKNGVFWVLSRMRIRVIRYPKWDEEVTVETWPNGFEKLFAMREYRMRDSKGETIAIGSSGWLVVDINTRRPMRSSDTFFLYAERVDPVFDRPIDKIILPDDMRSSGQKRVVFSDIDIIGHVNNVKYIEWSLDQFPPDKLLKQPIQEVEINYLNESLQNDVIEIKVHDSENDRACIGAVRRSDNKEIYRMRIQLFPD